MLVFDELKKNDPQLRLVAGLLVAGLLILLGGLWWVQVVSAREYQSHLENQSYRTIRLPAERGKILDREGRVLAENRPCYNLSLYLEDLGGQFRDEYARLKPVNRVTNAPPFWKFWSSTPTVKTRPVRLKAGERSALEWQARYNVVYRLAQQTGAKVGQPVTVNPNRFYRAYQTRLALPFPILEDLDVAQIARFQENYSSNQNVNLELEPVRYYPYGQLAGHLLGYLQEDDRSMSGEEADYNYRLPDYHGVVGVEYGYDDVLRGRAGLQALQVDNKGYRRSENVWLLPEPGRNVVLTLDLDLQQAAEKALLTRFGPDARAAVVIMDVRNGQVLALASSPAFDPVFSENSPERMSDDALRPLINRATQENYAPGSIFKPVIGLAALEAGLNPKKEYTVEADPADPRHGWFNSGRLKIRDTVAPGRYDFKRAIEHSSNSYFIQIGLEAGAERIMALAEKFHFGEKTGLPTRQETRGTFPAPDRVRRWSAGDTANLCIGQGEVAVTPLQMAAAYSAIANGGTLFWPQLVLRVEPQGQTTPHPPAAIPAGLVRDRLGVSARSLGILHDAMLSETEVGSGVKAQVPGLQICGKTGTAQVQNSSNHTVGYNYWFASFAPYENPHYAVVVMVQIPGPLAGFGGTLCAPVAHDIYEVILQKETAGANRPVAMIR